MGNRAASHRKTSRLAEGALTVRSLYPETGRNRLFGQAMSVRPVWGRRMGRGSRTACRKQCSR